MKHKKIKLLLTQSGIENAIREVKAYQTWLKSKTRELRERLAEVGIEVAKVEFDNAQYDGTNDVAVHMEDRGDNRTAIVAVGRAVLFIEFGSGVSYPDSHPLAGELDMKHGEFGYGLGKFRSWRYTGDPGTNGEVITEGKHKGEIITKGNPANMPMYKATKEIEQQFKDIAREVFGTD